MNSRFLNSTLDPVQLEQELLVSFMGEEQQQRQEQELTLVSQFSVNRLETFAKVIENWAGPISIAM